MLLAGMFRTATSPGASPHEAMLTFILLNGGAVLAAFVVAARLGLRERASALVLGTASGYLVLVHSSVLLAGVLGYLTTGFLATLVTAVVLAAAWWARTLRRAPPISPEPARVTAASLFAPLAAITAGAAWAWPHLFEATRLWVWDDYTYHMVYPALWLRDHTIAAAIPAQAFTMQAWYPLSASVVATWFMVPFSGGRAEALAWVSLTGLLYAGIVGGGTGELCRRLGCRRWAWAVPVGLFATSHRTAIMAGGFSDADLAQAASLFGAFALAIPRGDVEASRDVRVDAWYAGLLTGLALGMKVSAAPQALIVLLVIALRARALGAHRGERMRAVAGVGLVFALCWAATGGYWYARNLIYTGNPVYPAAFLTWPGATFPETTLLEYARRYGVRRTMADALAVYTNWPNLHAWLALVGLVGLPAWCLARRRSLTRPQRYYGWATLAVAAAVLVWLPAAPFSAGNAMTFRSGFVHWDSMRYVAILLLLGWAALGVLVDAGGGAGHRRTLAAVLIAAAGLLTSGLPWLVPLVIAAAGVLGAAVLARVPGSRFRAARAEAFAAGTVVVAGAAIIIWSHEAKTAATGAEFYREPLFGGAAAVLDRQPSGTRVAVFGDQWVYPAFGDRLHLQPVRLDRNGTVATGPIADAMEPGNRTVSPATFRSRLEAAGIGLVVVVHQPHPGRPADFPTQHAALEATADAHLVYRNRGVVIWRLGSRSAPGLRAPLTDSSR